MCKYCDDKNKDFKFLWDNKIGIENEELIISDRDYVIRDIIINYCPMCGRKLIWKKYFFDWKLGE